MNLLERLYTWFDNLRTTDRATFAPAQRTPSELLRLHLAPSRLEDIFDHCRCCPPACTEVHRDACPVHQAGALA